MQEVLARQPNYTCVEVMERSRRSPPRFKHELVDMVRLEVALVDGKELFAWPGSAKFEEQDLGKVVPRGGAVGNGNFALFARTVFQSIVPIFDYKGIVDLDGKRSVRYDYRVAQLNSGLKLQVNNAEAVVGFHGSFWADPDTLDVQRLQVIADDIPTALQLVSSSTTVDYSRLQIGGGEFLLPKASDLAMTHISGVEDHNRVRFSACRQYTGESVLKFGDVPESAEDPAPKPIARHEVEIPAGLSFDVSLEEEITSERSMVGDPIKATLRQNLKYERRTIMDKGATVVGRIVRLERHSDHCVIDLQFSEFETSDLHAIFSGSAEEAHMLTSNPGLNYTSPRTTAHTADTGAIVLKGNRLHLPKGVRVRVRTATRQ